MYLLNPPHSASCSTPNARFKHKLLLLAAGVSVYAIVLLKECSIKAVAQEHSVAPTSRIAQRPTAPTAAQTQVVIRVNPQIGNDAKADGSEQAPFRTLTQALQAAQSNTLIQLTAGTYSSETGEVFPIALKAGVTVQGNPEDLGQGTVIRGGGAHSSPIGRQNVTLVGANQATLTGVTITNPQSRGHGLWVEAGNPTIRDNTFISSANAGMVALGSSVATVHNNLFVLNRTGGMVISGHAQPDVRDNIFQRTGAGITISEDAAPQLIGNRISQNRDGIIVQGNAHPVIRENAIEDSDRDGIVVIAQAQPDLGTAKAPGNNTFLNNRQHDINALATNQTLPAFGNQLASQQIAGKVDLTGNAPLVSVTTVASTASRLPVTQVNRSTPSPSTARSFSAGSTTTPPTPAPTRISSLPPSNSLSNQATRSTSSRLPQPVFTSMATEARSRSVAQPADHQQNNQPSELSVPTPSQSMTQSAAVEIAVPSAERPSSQSTQPSDQRSAQPSGSAARLRPTVRPIVHRPQVGASATRLSAQSTAARSTTARSTETHTTVEIAVPPPEQAASIPVAVPQLANVAVTPAASLPRQTVAMASPAIPIAVPTIGGAPISIPVPPPEMKANSSTPTAETASANGDVRILPVPRDEIPVGNTSGVARIEVAQAFSATANRRDLQYRVVVEADDEQTQSLVRSIVPGAFVTSIQGQAVVQIGAFSSRDNAQEAIQMLSQSGLQGIIQPME